jgi:hypothetical protein
VSRVSALDGGATRSTGCISGRYVKAVLQP